MTAVLSPRARKADPTEQLAPKDLISAVAVIADKMIETAEQGPWMVNIFGVKCSRAWEISVVRKDNHHGRASWGWFDANKLLVSHNGSPCDWPIVEFVWDAQVRCAHELCHKLNSGHRAIGIAGAKKGMR